MSIDQLPNSKAIEASLNKGLKQFATGLKETIGSVFEKFAPTSQASDETTSANIENSRNYAKQVIEDASLFGSENGIASQNGSVDKNAMKFYIAHTYSEQIANYYMDNGVNFENNEQMVNALVNTGQLISYSLDIDTSGDISEEEIMLALSFADNIEENIETSKSELISYVNSPVKSENKEITPNESELDISQQEFEALFNFLTTGVTEFEKFNDGDYKEQLNELLNSSAFENALVAPFLNDDDIRTKATAKYREGSEMQDIDYDSIVKLLDYNRMMQIFFEMSQD